MKTGPKNKPIALRILADDIHLSDAERNAPMVEPGLPAMPQWLTGYAKTVWDRLARKLAENNIISTFDRDILAQYCVLVSRFREAVQTENDSMMLKIAQQLRITASELGLTPASRASLGGHIGNRAKTPKSKASILMGGGG